MLQSHLLLSGFFEASVTLCIYSVTLSKYILDVHPTSDSMEIAEAVPIDVRPSKSQISKRIRKMLTRVYDGCSTGSHGSHVVVFSVGKPNF